MLDLNNPTVGDTTEILSVSKNRNVFNILLSLMVLLLGVWLVSDADEGNLAKLLAGWLAILFSGTCGLIIVVGLFKGLPRVILTPTSIQHLSLFKSREWKWGDVGLISANSRVLMRRLFVNRELFGLYGFTNQHYEKLTRSKGKAAIGINDADIHMVINGLSGCKSLNDAKEIALKINRWRERYSAPNIALNAGQNFIDEAAVNDIEKLPAKPKPALRKLLIPISITVAVAVVVLALISFGGPVENRFYNLVTGSDTRQNVSQKTIAFEKKLRRFVDQGDAKAQIILGEFYSEGLVGIQDHAIAVKRYRKAAEQGSKRAQTSLGYLYSKGIGVPKDFEASARWYRKAADQGFAIAQYSLGVAFNFGKGLSRDFVAAAKLFRQAANQGFAPAQFTLGLSYGLGEGVEKNYIKSYQWLSIADKQGHEDAEKLREILEKEMLPGKIVEAKMHVRNFEFRFKRGLSQ